MVTFVTNLPIFEAHGKRLALPIQTGILDPKEVFNRKTHLFQPIQELTSLMHDYAVQVVSNIDVIAKQRLDSGEIKDPYKNFYKRFDSSATNDVRWKIRSKDDAQEKTHIVAASDNEGAWERFLVGTNSSGIEKVRWEINGFLPGALELSKDKQGEWNLSLNNPGVMPIQKKRDYFLHNPKVGLKRFHNCMVREAQSLIDLHRKHKINGGAVKIGENQFFVRRIEGILERKEYHFVQDGDPEDRENSSQFIVLANPDGSIESIEQLDAKANISFKLTKNGFLNFHEGATLQVFDREQQRDITGKIEKIDGKIQDAKSLSGIFPEGLTAVTNFEAQKKQLIREYASPESSTKINIKQETAIAENAKKALLAQANLDTLEKELGLLYRSPSAKQVSDSDREFYRYTGITEGQLSTVFFKGKVHKVKVNHEDGEKKALGTFGHIDLRRKFLISPEHFDMTNDNFLSFLKDININLTNEKQNNAIYRWVFLHNKETLKELGICFEESKDPKKKDKVHFLTSIGRDKFKSTKLKLQLGTKDFGELDLMRFPSIELIRQTAKVLNPGLGQYPPHIDSFDVLKGVLENVGFELAEARDTEEFIRGKLSNATESEGMKKDLEALNENFDRAYINSLSLSLAEASLTEEGYTLLGRFQAREKGRTVGKTSISILCEKEGKRFLVKPVMTNGNATKSFQSLERFTDGADAQAMLVKLKKIDPVERTAESYKLILRESGS